MRRRGALAPNSQVGKAAVGDTAPGPVVQVAGLIKRFGSHTAVDRLDLTIAAGEIFGLVGPDGAGKTTTLRVLTGIMRPTAGRVTLWGRDMVRDSESVLPHIGYMAQRFNLYRDLTVRENLDFFAEVFSMSGERRSRQVARLIAFAGLEQFVDRRAEHLSGGMQKKLALACTLVHGPRALFLDEPTTGVDPVSRREFWKVLTQLHLEGITIVVSTPYMDEAERCSRVGMMYRGQLVHCDTPDALRSLTPGSLLEVRTPQLRSARQAVEGLDGVLEVQTYGDRLHVFVDDIDVRRPHLEAAFAAAGIDIVGLRATRPRMEEAFLSLVRAQRVGE